MVIFEVICRTTMYTFNGLFTKIPSVQELKEAVDSVIEYDTVFHESDERDQIKSNIHRELEGGRFHTRERYVQEL